MEQLVKVTQVNDDGTALVRHERLSACSGDCHKCAGCGAARETMLLTARNPIGAKPGDLVVISSSSSSVLKAAAVLYILPLCLFFLGYLLGELYWQKGALISGIGFLLGIGLAGLYDRLVLKKKKTVYTITEFGRT